MASVRSTILSAALILTCMVVAIGFLGVQKIPAAELIDKALDASRIVLVFPSKGDPEAVSADPTVPTDLKSRFGETMQTPRRAAGQYAWADRKYPVDQQAPTPFIITNADSKSFIIEQHFESPLDAGAIETATNQVLDDATS
jgi:hypothetical protein